MRVAYGMPKSDDPLAFLLAMNGELKDRSEKGVAIVGPGLPPTYSGPPLITADAVKTTVAAAVKKGKAKRAKTNA